MRILLFGDENFSFCNGFLLDHEDDIVEVCSCLKENELKQESKNNIQSLNKNVVIHYGINPVQLKSKFPPNTFDALYYILPGLSFHGYPDFIDPQTEMFKLRLNLFCFSFLKSSKNIIKPDGYVYLLLPLDPGYDRNVNVNDNNIHSVTNPGSGILSNTNNKSCTLPFLPIEPKKLAKFCNVVRENTKDYDLDMSAHPNWIPVLFNMPIVNEIPEWLNSCKYYCFKMTEIDNKNKASKINTISNNDSNNNINNNVDESKNQNNSKNETEKNEDNNVDINELDENKEKEEDPDEYNVLKIPPQVFDYPIEKLGHVNECFLFKLYSINSKSILISRLTLKYDPRISGWKGDNKMKKDMMNNIPLNNMPMNMVMNMNNMNMMKNMNNLMNMNKFKGGKFKNKSNKNDFQQQYKNSIMQNNINYNMNKKTNMNLPPPPPTNISIQPNTVNIPNQNMNYKQNNYPFVSNFKNIPTNLSQNVQNSMTNMPLNVNPNMSNNLMNPYINGGYNNNFRNNMYQQNIPMPPLMNNFNKKIFQGHNINTKRKNELYNGDDIEKTYDNYNMKNYKSDDENINANNMCNDDYDLDQYDYTQANQNYENKNSEDPDYYFLKQGASECNQYGAY